MCILPFKLSGSIVYSLLSNDGKLLWVRFTAVSKNILQCILHVSCVIDSCYSEKLGPDTYYLR